MVANPLADTPKLTLETFADGRDLVAQSFRLKRTPLTLLQGRLGRLSASLLEKEFFLRRVGLRHRLRRWRDIHHFQQTLQREKAPQDEITALYLLKQGVVPGLTVRERERLFTRCALHNSDALEEFLRKPDLLEGGIPLDWQRKPSEGGQRRRIEQLHSLSANWPTGFAPKRFATPLQTSLSWADIQRLADDKTLGKRLQRALRAVLLQDVDMFKGAYDPNALPADSRLRVATDNAHDPALFFKVQGLHILWLLFYPEAFGPFPKEFTSPYRTLMALAYVMEMNRDKSVENFAVTPQFALQRETAAEEAKPETVTLADTLSDLALTPLETPTASPVPPHAQEDVAPLSFAALTEAPPPAPEAQEAWDSPLESMLTRAPTTAVEETTSEAVQALDRTSPAAEAPFMNTGEHEPEAFLGGPETEARTHDAAAVFEAPFLETRAAPLPEAPLLAPEALPQTPAETPLTPTEASSVALPDTALPTPPLDTTLDATPMNTTETAALADAPTAPVFEEDPTTMTTAMPETPVQPEPVLTAPVPTAPAQTASTSRLPASPLMGQTLSPVKGPLTVAAHGISDALQHIELDYAKVTFRNQCRSLLGTLESLTRREYALGFFTALLQMSRPLPPANTDKDHLQVDRNQRLGFTAAITTRLIQTEGLEKELQAFLYQPVENVAQDTHFWELVLLHAWPLYLQEHGKLDEKTRQQLPHIARALRENYRLMLRFIHRIHAEDERFNPSKEFFGKKYKNRFQALESLFSVLSPREETLKEDVTLSQRLTEAVRGCFLKEATGDAQHPLADAAREQKAITLAQDLTLAQWGVRSAQEAVIAHIAHILRIDPATMPAMQKLDEKTRAEKIDEIRNRQATLRQALGLASDAHDVEPRRIGASFQKNGPRVLRAVMAVITPNAPKERITTLIQTAYGVNETLRLNAAFDNGVFAQLKNLKHRLALHNAIQAFE